MNNFQNIKLFGFQKSSLIDYPEYISSVIFFNGCNLSCEYCHNRKAMQEYGIFTREQVIHTIYDVITNLSKGIVISGGEPTIQDNDLIYLLQYLKQRTNKKIKLDTNGTNPEVLKNIIDNKLVDFIAMDVKAKFENYSKYFHYNNIDNLYKSIDLISRSGLNYQFRNTLWQKLTLEDKDWIIKNFPDIKFQEEITEI